MRTNKRSGVTRKSCFAQDGNAKESLEFPEVRGGQSDPRHYPYLKSSEFLLGGPLDIEDVALLLGCSPWTVRQKFLPQGLPYLRASASGKLIFFRRQVLDWILERQRKEEWK